MGPDLSNHVVISFPRNLDTVISLPGGESLRGFILVTVLVEKAAVPGIKVSSHSQLYLVTRREISLTGHPPGPFPAVN